MSEMILIFKAIGFISLAIISLSILVPLSFYMYEKRQTSRVYRQIEFSIVFILISIWGHTWSNSIEYLQIYWIIVIMMFIIGSGLIWFSPLKREIKSRTKKERKR